MIFLKFHLKTLGTILICILHMIIPYNADGMRNKVFSCKFSFDLSVARMQKISRKGIEKEGLKEKPQNTCIIKYNELRQTQEGI